MLNIPQRDANAGLKERRRGRRVIVQKNYAAPVWRAPQRSRKMDIRHPVSSWGQSTLTSCSFGLSRKISDVQRVAERPQRCFLHGFTQCRMGVDGGGNVFQAGTHFQRM